MTRTNTLLRAVLVLHIVLVLDDAERDGELPELDDDLLLHEVDHHGDDGEAHEEVDAGDDELGLAVLGAVVEDGVAGHKVAEADGGERDEAEVAAVQHAPALPRRE